MSVCVCECVPKCVAEFVSWCCPQERCEARQQALGDALQAQQFYADAAEAESWMRDRELLVGVADYGKDEDSAQVRGTETKGSEARGWRSCNNSSSFSSSSSFLLLLRHC